MRALAMAWLAAGAASAVRAEDEAHRLDRLETRQLNLHALAARPIAPAGPVANTAAPSAAEQALREREQRAIDRWRAAAAACRTANRSDDC